MRCLLQRACALLLLLGCASTPPAPAVRQHPEDLPIVLVHGLSGFRNLSGIDYFYGVPGLLRDKGHRVFVAHVPPWAPVDVRAQHLKEQVESALARTHAPRVHIIAHSMGGLDARFAISRLDMGGKVASLSTIGTPHRGTPLADGYDLINLTPTHVIQDAAADFWIWTLGGMQVHSDTAGAVQSLSETHAQEFNAATPDDARVRYYSFAGRTLGNDGTGVCDDAVWPNPKELDVAPAVLFTTALFLSGPPGQSIANDGLVTVQSAKWGIFMGCFPADHMEEVGQPVNPIHVPGRWNHLEFYERWAAELTNGTALSYAAKAPTL